MHLCLSKAGDERQFLLLVSPDPVSVVRLNRDVTRQTSSQIPVVGGKNVGKKKNL